MDVRCWTEEKLKHDIVRDLDQTFHKIDVYTIYWTSSRRCHCSSADGFGNMTKSWNISVSNHVEYKETLSIVEQYFVRSPCRCTEVEWTGLRVLRYLSYKSQPINDL